MSDRQLPLTCSNEIVSRIRDMRSRNVSRTIISRIFGVTLHQIRWLDSESYRTNIKRKADDVAQLKPISKDKLVARDIEILDDLRAAVDNYVRIGAGVFVQPLDCGGSNNSDHSYRLAKLCRAGLARRERRGVGAMVRGSWRYTITDEGREHLKGFV